MIIELFIAGSVIHMLFIAWYVNLRGPLKAPEIEKVMKSFEGSAASENTKPEDFRKFMEEDDGREFFMVNYVDLQKGDDGKEPGTGNSSDTLQKYFKPFVKALFKRGGHPVYMLNRVGGNVDTWNSDDEINFEVMAMMRYRSRRDLAELIISSNLPDIHKFKLKAIKRTISFPVHFKMTAFIKPSYWVPLLILLIVSLLSIGINAIY